MEQVEKEAAEPREDLDKVKKPYETPTVTRLGTIAEITNGTGPPNKDGIGGSTAGL